MYSLLSTLVNHRAIVVKRVFFKSENAVTDGTSVTSTAQHARQSRTHLTSARSLPSRPAWPEIWTSGVEADAPPEIASSIGYYVIGTSFKTAANFIKLAHLTRYSIWTKYQAGTRPQVLTVRVPVLSPRFKGGQSVCSHAQLSKSQSACEVLGSSEVQLAQYSN